MILIFIFYNVFDLKYIGLIGNVIENEGSILKVDMGRCFGCDIELMDEDFRGC